MKTLKSIVMLIILLVAALCHSQYARTLIEFETGAGKLENVASVGFGNVHGHVRHNFNPYFSIKSGIGYTNYYDYEILEASVQGVVNMGRVLQFETFAPNTTILAFGGVGMTDSDYPTNETIIYRDTHFNPVLGFQIERRITERVFFGIGGNVMPGINYRPTSDIGTTNKWEFNAFVSIPILNGNDVHADFYIAPEKADPRPIIIDNTKLTINNIPVKTDTVSRGSEYVYFNHDSYKLDKDARANIEKAFQGSTKFRVIAHCSMTGTVEYNINLAKLRAESVARELYLLAKAEGTFIVVEEVAEGIDYNRKDTADFARRVVIEFE